MPVVSALEEQRQQGHKIAASLIFRVHPKADMSTWQGYVTEKQNTVNKQTMILQQSHQSHRGESMFKFPLNSRLAQVSDLVSNPILSSSSWLTPQITDLCQSDSSKEQTWGQDYT